jgi:hypothetical protein
MFLRGFSQDVIFIDSSKIVAIIWSFQERPLKILCLQHILNQHPIILLN